MHLICVHAELGVPESIAAATPLPEVLVAIDPERFPSMSRARKACRRGSVLVNGMEGRCITTARAGDVLSLQSRVAPGFTPRGRAPFPVDVLFEDDAMVRPSTEPRDRAAAAAFALPPLLRCAAAFCALPPPV